MVAEKVVYIVDDDVDIRRSLERLLKSTGFRAISYAAPLEFLEVAAGLPAGCALLDIQMPEMDGLELQRRPLEMKVALPVIRRAGVDRSAEIAAAVARIGELSPREREVLDALVSGLPNKLIAFDLGLSVRTVEVHRARMMGRLGVRQFAEAIRLAALARLADGE